MKKRCFKHSIKSFALFGLCFSAVSGEASTVTLLDVDFNNVAGMTLATTVRAVSSVLGDIPDPLAGALWSASSGTDANVGIRRTDNNINVNTLNSFESFFPASATNKFLVMGDQVGPITGVANQGIFGFALPFSTVAGFNSLSISFDWAFAGINNSSTVEVEDLFSVGIAGNDFSINSPMTPAITLLSQTSPKTSFFNLNGHYNGTISLDTLPIAASGDIYYLVFGLSEHANTDTNSAIGIDNIKISAVPLPAAVWLFGSAFAVVAGISRRKQSR